MENIAEHKYSLSSGIKVKAPVSEQQWVTYDISHKLNNL